MIKIPIKLYYKENGQLFTQGNLNSVPMLNKLSNYAYSLFLVTPYEPVYTKEGTTDVETTSVFVSFEKSDGTTTDQYPMSWCNTVPVKVGTTEQMWNVYKCEIEDEVLTISSYEHENKIGIGFSIKRPTGETTIDGEAIYQTLNCSPYYTTCNYTVVGNTRSLEDTSLDILTNYLNNALKVKINNIDGITKTDKFPTLVYDSNDIENYNVGRLYIVSNPFGIEKTYGDDYTLKYELGTIFYGDEEGSWHKIVDGSEFIENLKNELLEKINQNITDISTNKTDINNLKINKVEHITQAKFDVGLNKDDEGKVFVITDGTKKGGIYYLESYTVNESTGSISQNIIQLNFNYSDFLTLRTLTNTINSRLGQAESTISSNTSRIEQAEIDINTNESNISDILSGSQNVGVANNYNTTSGNIKTKFDEVQTDYNAKIDKKLNKVFSDLGLLSSIGDNAEIVFNINGEAKRIAFSDFKEAIYSGDFHRGYYSSVSELNNITNPKKGDYAFVDLEIDGESDLVMYIWDDTDKVWSMTNASQYLKTTVFDLFQKGILDGTTPVGKANVANDYNTEEGTIGQKFNQLENQTIEFSDTIEDEEVAVLRQIKMGDDVWKIMASDPQTSFNVVQNLVVNMNGVQFEGYKFVEFTYPYGDYTVKQMVTNDENATPITDISIIEKYMLFMSGNDYVPVYKSEKPLNVFFITEEKKVWKMQYDTTNGLLAFMLDFEFGGGTEEGISKAFIDVDELPTVGWSGTAVPNSGTVESVYFNTNLSVEEVVSLLDSIENWSQFDETSVVYPLLIDTSNFHQLLALKDTSENIYAIFYQGSLGEIPIFENAGNMFGFEGWSSELEESMTLNATLISDMEGIAVGVENDLLSSLFSTTPFVQSEVNEDVFYRVTSGGATAVPNSGYVEKVYFNTSLTVEEVVSSLENFTGWVFEEENFGFYIALSNSDGATGVHLTISKEDITVVTMEAIVNGEPIAVFQSTQAFTEFDFIGWNPNVDFSSGFEINVEVVNELDSLPVGEQNDLIKDIISTTSFTDPTTELYYFKDTKPHKLLEEVITDVTELPTEGDEKLLYRLNTETDPTVSEGTTVPNEGTVETIYFNTNTSVEEVVSVLETLTFDSNGMYTIFKDSSSTKYIIVVKGDDGYIVYDIQQCINEGSFSAGTGANYTYFNTSQSTADTMTEGSFIGWNSKFEYIDINLENSITDNQNELLKDIISITPFEYTDGEKKSELYNYKDGEYKKILQEGDEKSIIDVETTTDEVSWSGTAVPESGIVEKVYINDNLSIEEVKNIIENIEYTDASSLVSEGNYMAIIIGDSALSNGLAILKYTGETILDGVTVGLTSYRILYVSNGTIYNLFIYASYSNGVIDNASAWGTNQEYYTNTIEFNMENELVALSQQLGVALQNDKLSSLFSITPFVKEKEETINKNKIYRKTDKVFSSYSGTLVNSSNETTEKIYFNTEMSIESVNTALKGNFTFTSGKVINGKTYSLATLIAERDGSKAIGVFTFNDGYSIFYVPDYNLETMEINYIFNSSSTNSSVAGFTGWGSITEIEWNTNTEGSFLDVFSYSISNRYITSFFSSAPIKKIYNEIENLYYYSKKDNTTKKIFTSEQGSFGIFKTTTVDNYSTFPIVELTYDELQSLFESDIAQLTIEAKYADGASMFYFLTKVGGQKGALGNSSKNLYTILLTGYRFDLFTGKLACELSLTNLGINAEGTDFTTLDLASGAVKSAEKGLPYLYDIVKSGVSLFYKKYDSYGESYSNSFVTFDTTPTSGSTNPITSGAVYTALEEKVNTTDVNQMIADYITANFENGDEGSY